MMKRLIVLSILLFAGTAQAASFAKLDSQGNVLQVIEVTDDNAKTELAGITFLQKLFGSDTIWKQTDPQKILRKNFAGPGFTYDSKLNAFIPPKPIDDPDAILNQTTATWTLSAKAQDAQAIKLTQLQEQ